ncbi:MAG: RNA methyltransferase [Candidatus Kapaibacterium sp.]|nr:MAG: RNA methyltransferase [Candidatus Kapabacteria bacterium]
MVTQHLCDELARAIACVLQEHRHADRALKRLLGPLPPHDERRQLIARTVYSVLRHLRRLVWALGEPETFSAEQIGRCIRAWWVLASVPMGKALRSGIPPRSALSARWDNPPSRAVRSSIPEWLDRYGAEQCGNRWDALLAAFETEPHIVLRTNTLKTTRNELLEQFHRRGIAAAPHPVAPDAIVLSEYVNVFALEEFHAGLFEMQDAASQAIAPLLDVAPGMRVVDACAGSGGKTLHLAALMKNRGRIIALDTAAWKLAELRRRAARAGASCIETRAITSTKVIKRLAGSADRLLLDLPCSGSGVWRRNPDGKWHLQPADMERYHHVQQQILRAYLPMLAPSGIAVVCTCSIFPDEGERLCQTIASSSRWHVLDTGRFDPSAEVEQDGFFWARIQQR